MEPEKKSNGAFLGLVVIIIILILGGLYIWHSNQKAKESMQNQAVTSKDQDDLNALELDANSTDSNIGVDANTVN